MDKLRSEVWYVTFCVLAVKIERNRRHVMECFLAPLVGFVECEGLLQFESPNLVPELQLKLCDHMHIPHYL